MTKKIVAKKKAQTKEIVEFRVAFELPPGQTFSSMRKVIRERLEHDSVWSVKWGHQIIRGIKISPI